MTFINFKYYIKLIIRFIFSYKFKFIVLLFTFLYCIILIILSYFLYKKYLETLHIINTNNLSEISRDITNLVSLHPLNINHIIEKPNIDYLYNITGITHYSDFINSDTIDSNSLQIILRDNPNLDSKFSNIVLQSIIKDHTEEVIDVSLKFIKLAGKLSLPLAGCLLFICISFLLDNSNSMSDILLKIS